VRLNSHTLPALNELDLSQSEQAPHPETQPAPQSLKEFLDLVSDDPEPAGMLRKSYYPDPEKEPAAWQTGDIKIRVVPRQEIVIEERQ